MQQGRQIMETENDSSENGKKVLTSIHEMYTLSTTPTELTEADKVIVRHFLNALAEIALAVASRKDKKVKQ